MKPGDSSGDLFDGLAACLLHKNALPELGADRTGFKELAKILRETPKAAVPLIKGGLSQAASEMAKSEQLKEQPTARLVLVVDQMEEMFSLESITHEERIKFIEALDALSRSGRVWVIATLRSDFYPRTSELEGLVTLKEGTGQYDLLAPTPAEIGQMIRQPAQAAGLYFEEDTTTNERLDDVLRDAAAKNPAALPLLEFTLEELYKQRTDNGMLTYEAYKKLGGVEGALAQRAEEVFGGLEPKVQQAMDVELHSLISIGVDDGERISRKYAPLEIVTTTPETKAFVEAFVKARLFTTDLAADGSAIVNIAHEALLQHWPRLQDWIEKNREDLRIRARVNAAARRWENENRSREFLLSAGKQVSEADELVKNKSIELTDTEKTFVHASIAKSKRIYWIKRAIAAVLVVLTIAASGAAYLAIQQRDRAETEAQTSEQVSDFLVGLFEVSDPSEALGDTITAREILDRGAEKIKEELKDQPEIQATLMITMGKVYQSLGLYKNAIPLIDSAIAARRQIFGDVNIEVADGINELATLYHNLGDFKKAELLYMETIELTRSILGDEDTFLATSLLNLGQLKSDIGKFEEAEPLFNDAMVIFKKYQGEEHWNTVNCLKCIGGLKYRKGDIQGAEQIFTEVLHHDRKIYGDTHPTIANDLNNLAGMKENLGDLSSADSLMREALSINRKIYGDKHPAVSRQLGNLGNVLCRKQQYKEAEILYKKALQINRDLYGNEFATVAINLNDLASLYVDTEKLDTAEVLYEEALQINRKLYGEFHPEIATNLHNYSILLYRKGDREKAEAMSREALEIFRSFVGDIHPAIATISDNLVKIMLAQGKYVEAEEKMRNIIEIREQVFPADSWMITDSKAKWGNCLAKLKRYEEAETILLESYPILKLEPGEDHPATKAAIKYIINLYKTWGKPEKIAEYEAFLPDTTAVSETQ
jgi:tetratricopeptide (TPR) repeat protein